MPAWAAVPQAVMMIFSNLSLLFLQSGSSPGSLICPSSKSTLPASVSVSDRTCSWISFCMKCRYSPFSADTGSHAMDETCGLTFTPSRVMMVTRYRGLQPPSAWIQERSPDGCAPEWQEYRMRRSFPFSQDQSPRRRRFRSGQQ